ncbi:MAG TPA: CtsR family transcriptional regulator [Firmicutes bacterium]|nr:CtsR family transcriptional regulator [Bacillota bacterium]
MASLCDHIEDYLKRLLAVSPSRHIDIQRREVAGKFNCVPSQINYVLNTRFSIERGYLVESKRGGRGYIRIYRVDPLKTKAWEEMLARLEDERFDPQAAVHFLHRIYEERFISRREARLVKSLLEEEHYLTLNDQEVIRQLQGKLFQAVLKAILKG